MPHLLRKASVPLWGLEWILHSFLSLYRSQLTSSFRELGVTTQISDLIRSSLESRQTLSGVSLSFLMSCLLVASSIRWRPMVLPTCETTDISALTELLRGSSSQSWHKSHLSFQHILVVHSFKGASLSSPGSFQQHQVLGEYQWIVPVFLPGFCSPCRSDLDSPLRAS